MVNSILTSVTKQLGATFGNSYTYYIENVEQGLKKPCFLVMVTSPIMRSKSPVLYDWTIPVVVHWFSDKNKDIKKKCYGMAEQIIECLEYLPFKNGLIRGEDISWHLVDDEALEIFITYDFTTKRVTDVEDSIETFETNVTHTQ